MVGMRNGRRTFWIGVGLTLLGGALWGASGSSVQYLTAMAGAAPALVTLMRTVVGALLFTAFLLWRAPCLFCEVFVRPRTIAVLLLFGLALYGNQLCYAQTVKITNAGTATVLQMLGSVFVMAYVCVANRKPPRKRELAGLIIAVMATLLIACQGDVRTLNVPPDGLVWGVLCGLSMALYIVLPKRLGLFDRFGAVAVTGLGMMFGVLFALPGYLLQGGSMAEAAAVLGGFDGMAWLVFFGGVVAAGTLGGYGLYLKGVSIVGSVKGSLLGAIEPVSAMIIAALWLGTAFTGYDVAGMILMCVMVACVTGDEPD